MAETEGAKSRESFYLGDLAGYHWFELSLPNGIWRSYRRRSSYFRSIFMTWAANLVSEGSTDE